MVHNKDVEPLYIRGQQASEELARLAEDGNPGLLVEKYGGLEGVGTVFAHTPGVGGSGPLFGGETTSIDLEVSDEYPLVTIASMAINTNDCFVAINSMPLRSGMVVSSPGLDAGSEENNENCNSIPGPACPEGSGNQADGNGEGFVHVHRGFFGVGTDKSPLSEKGYDWRNPMMRVVVR